MTAKVDILPVVIRIVPTLNGRRWIVLQDTATVGTYSTYEAADTAAETLAHRLIRFGYTVFGY